MPKRKRMHEVIANITAQKQIPRLDTYVDQKNHFFATAAANARSWSEEDQVWHIDRVVPLKRTVDGVFNTVRELTLTNGINMILQDEGPTFMNTVAVPMHQHQADHTQTTRTTVTQTLAIVYRRLEELAETWEDERTFARPTNVDKKFLIGWDVILRDIHACMDREGKPRLSASHFFKTGSFIRNRYDEYKETFFQSVAESVAENAPLWPDEDRRWYRERVVSLKDTIDDVFEAVRKLTVGANSTLQSAFKKFMKSIAMPMHEHEAERDEANAQWTRATVTLTLEVVSQKLEQLAETWEDEGTLQRLDTNEKILIIGWDRIVRDIHACMEREGKPRLSGKQFFKTRSFVRVA